MRWVALLAVLTIASPAVADDVSWQGVVLRAGAATTPGPEPASGPLYGIAYRVETRQLAFEVGTAFETTAPRSWDGRRTADAIVRDVLAVRALYRRELADVALHAGGGLGFGNHRVYAHTPWSMEPEAFEARGGHVELRAGFAAGTGPVMTIDVGVRLPLQRVTTDATPAWWPTFDASVGIGLGGARGDGAYAGTVALADLAFGALAWSGALELLDELFRECHDSCDDADAGAARLFTGLIGYAVVAPAIHATQGDARAARQSLWYRAIVAGSLGFIGALGGQEGFFLGAVAGSLIGAAIAPVVDYALARKAAQR